MHNDTLYNREVAVKTHRVPFRSTCGCPKRGEEIHHKSEEMEFVCGIRARGGWGPGIEIRKLKTYARRVAHVPRVRMTILTLTRSLPSLPIVPFSSAVASVNFIGSVSAVTSSNRVHTLRFSGRPIGNIDRASAQHSSPRRGMV